MGRHQQLIPAIFVLLAGTTNAVANTRKTVFRNGARVNVGGSREQDCASGVQGWCCAAKKAAEGAACPDLEDSHSVAAVERCKLATDPVLKKIGDEYKEQTNPSGPGCAAGKVCCAPKRTCNDFTTGVASSPTAEACKTLYGMTTDWDAAVLWSHWREAKDNGAGTGEKQETDAGELAPVFKSSSLGMSPLGRTLLEKKTETHAMGCLGFKDQGAKGLDGSTMWNTASAGYAECAINLLGGQTPKKKIVILLTGFKKETALADASLRLPTTSFFCTKEFPKVKKATEKIDLVVVSDQDHFDTCKKGGTKSCVALPGFPAVEKCKEYCTTDEAARKKASCEAYNDCKTKVLTTNTNACRDNAICKVKDQRCVAK